MNTDQIVAIASRAGEMGGLSQTQARCCALMAAAEYALDRAERLRTTATFADFAVYRERDEAEADRLSRIAKSLQREAQGCNE